jgi:hypothetical protein
MARTSFSHLHGGSGRGFARRGHGIFYYGEGSAASDACTDLKYVHKLDVASLAANRRPPSRNEILRSWAVPTSLEPGGLQVRIFDIRRRVGLVLRREPEPPRVHDPRWLATPLT